MVSKKVTNTLKSTRKTAGRKIPRLSPVQQAEISSLAGAMEVRLNALKLGLAMGILCAVSMILFSLWVIFVGTGAEWISMIAQFYFGYSTTVSGILLGAVYGFIDGFVGGFVLAWIYNKLL